ncbi:colicin transporter [Sphingomonas sp. LaA6.9]|uniref:colicin transporter n=1 Tax=Sphingomonas sp. LaA6.9 TaxID=2919914 RepID=UPI001F4F864A|nr:colicin transporter [Sphingomonas sp. LaA6.9]MCJ8159182.1 colicin transporter [Sphingomonas sp. LaA6.9]
MIANRFKSVGRVLGGAVAAMALYLITSQVAAERTELERVNRQILTAKKDIRRLQTELATRANLRQLERWNGDVLALTTPDADQFLSGEVQLASLDRSGITPGPRYAPTTMVTAMVAIPDDALPASTPATNEPADRPASAARRELAAESAKPEKKSQTSTAKAQKPKAAPVKVAAVSSEKPRVDPKKAEKEKKLARLEDKLLDDRLMGELTKKARAEGGRRRQ